MAIKTPKGITAKTNQRAKTDEVSNDIYKPDDSLPISEEENLLYQIGVLDRRGWDRFEIAKELKIPIGKVQGFLRDLKERYMELQMEDRKALVNEKLAQLREVRKEAWEGWLTSKQEKVREVNEDSESTAGKSFRTHSKRQYIKESRIPASEFLQIILNCHQMEMELMGLDNSLFDTDKFDFDAIVTVLRSPKVPDQAEEKIKALENLQKRDQSLNQVEDTFLSPIEAQVLSSSSTPIDSPIPDYYDQNKREQ